jgi:hypothetical protein
VLTLKKRNGPTKSQTPDLSKNIHNISVATAIAGVFANFKNKMGKITEELEDVDKAKSQGVSCQH